MDSTKTNNVPVFEHGATIRIELRVSDSGELSRVEARFRNESEESVESIYRSVDLEDGADGPPIIELQVDENLPPGDYVCEYIAFTDKQGHKSLVAAPGIEFRIEGSAEEHQGPALLDWSFA